MGIKAVFGAANASVTPTSAGFTTPESVRELLTALKDVGVNNLDTARLYSGSEAMLGNSGVTDLSSTFIIDTKIKGGFAPGTAKRDQVISDIQDSLKVANVKQFDIVYIHAPDRETPFEETVEGMNEAYKQGYFRRFGLSNFNAEEVQQVYDIAQSKGYVLPTVYQSNYSPIARHNETLLFPTLRKLGMSIYVYSPLAGGFLTKTVQQLQDGEGRFNANDMGGLYSKLYSKPEMFSALAEWNRAAEVEGVSKAQLAYLWVAGQLDEEKGDAVLYGASKISQVRQTAEWLKKGSIKPETRKIIDEIWETVKEVSPVDNFNALRK